MTRSSPLKVEPVTFDDIPALLEIWFAAFNNPTMLEILPDTPKVCEWLAKSFERDLNEMPFQRFLKVTDHSLIDSQGRPRMMAWGKWDLSTPKERGPRYLPWLENVPVHKCAGFFGTLDANRKGIMGDEKHVYLELLCTHPDYRRRGAGSMLVEWGCDLADQQGVSAYVDASKNGASLYRKFGFVDYGDPRDEVASMARRKS